MISKSLTNRVFENIEQFCIEKYTQPLGVGSFGTVRLGTHKNTDKKYAVKIILKDKSFQKNELCLLERQIDIHYSLSHPHIVKLWDVLEENQKIYLIMEYAEKGNLFNYQNQVSKIPEVDAFKIFMQTIEAVDYLHKSNIFHRDLKPENILLDHELNIKLCDFGWAAPDIHRKRATFCGTYQYMAPEMINEEDYDYKIDIWALGVLLFQLNHSAAPFPAETIEEMKDRLAEGSYELSMEISTDLKALIMLILQFDPNDRPLISEIKKHPWIERMKRKLNQKSATLKFDKKKGKNIHGSLQLPSSSSKKSSKFGSMLFQDSSNKKQAKLPAAVAVAEVKKKLKKKCRTLEEESLEKVIKPYKNMLTTFTEKQNEDGAESYFGYNPGFSKKQKPSKLHEKVSKIREGKKLFSNTSTGKFPLNYNSTSSTTNQLNNLRRLQSQESQRCNVVEGKKKKKRVIA